MNKLKFCYYTALNYEKVERFLSGMESEGYILTSKRFLYFFNFKETKPRKVNYFLTFSPSGGSLSMYELERLLKSECGAAQIVKNKFQSPAIYRICDTDKSLHRFRRIRNLILKKMCINQSILGFSAFVFFELLFLLLIRPFAENWILHLIFNIPILVFSIYNLAGYFFLNNKSRGL